MNQYNENAATLINKAYCKYTANGGTFPYKHYNIYGWQQRKPNDALDDKDYRQNETDFSQISILENDAIKATTCETQIKQKPNYAIASNQNSELIDDTQFTNGRNIPRNFTADYNQSNNYPSCSTAIQIDTQKIDQKSMPGTFTNRYIIDETPIPENTIFQTISNDVIETTPMFENIFSKTKPIKINRLRNNKNKPKQNYIHNNNQFNEQHTKKDCFKIKPKFVTNQNNNYFENSSEDENMFDLPASQKLNDIQLKNNSQFDQNQSKLIEANKNAELQNIKLSIVNHGELLFNKYKDDWLISDDFFQKLDEVEANKRKKLSVTNMQSDKQVINKTNALNIELSPENVNINNDILADPSNYINEANLIPKTHQGNVCELLPENGSECFNTANISKQISVKNGAISKNVKKAGNRDELPEINSKEVILNQLAKYENDYVSDDFFTYAFGCTPKDAIIKQNQIRVGNKIESLNKPKNCVINSKELRSSFEKKLSFEDNLEQIQKCVVNSKDNLEEPKTNLMENIKSTELTQTFERKVSFEENQSDETPQFDENKSNRCKDIKENIQFVNSDKNCNETKNIKEQERSKNYVMEICKEPVATPKYLQTKLTDLIKVEKVKEIRVGKAVKAKKYKCNKDTKICDYFKGLGKPINTNKTKKLGLAKKFKQSKIKSKVIDNDSNQLKVNDEQECVDNPINLQVEFKNVEDETTASNLNKLHKKDENVSCKDNVESKRKPITDTFVLKRKKVKFCTPYKSQFEDLDATYEIMLINKNNCAELTKKIRSKFPVEINFNLIFKEGYCQLSRPSSIKSTGTPSGIIIGILWNVDTMSWHYLETLNSQENLKTDEFRNLITSLLSTSIRHNCYDAKALCRHVMCTFAIPASDVSMQWNLWDPLVGCWLLNPDIPPASFGGALAILELSNNCKVTSSESITNACYMITVLSEAVEKMRRLLDEKGLLTLFVELEMTIVSILAVMEIRGVCVASNTLVSMGGVLEDKLRYYEKRAHMEAGKSFRINSTVQVRSILYDELKLDTLTNAQIKETAVLKSKSTSEATLLILRNLHPLPNLILEYRHIHKAKTTYVENILKSVKDGFIHTTWDQIGAATGRLSSKNPNLQAIPKQLFSLTSFTSSINDSPEEKTTSLHLRASFVARHNYTLLAIDFQQIEFRVFAHLAQDARLLQAFRNPGDIFINLSKIWLGDISKSEADQRNQTKRIVYAVMYGAGTNKLAEILNIDPCEARKIIASFTSKFLGIREFGTTLIKKCQKDGYLTSVSGRRRYFPNISSPIHGLKAQSERQAVNFVIQGSAADICKAAMVYTERCLRENPQLDCALLLQIHDELVWEISDDCFDVAKDILINAICNTAAFCKSFGKITVPLPVCVEVGKNWGDMTSILKK